MKGTELTLLFKENEHIRILSEEIKSDGQSDFQLHGLKGSADALAVAAVYSQNKKEAI